MLRADSGMLIVPPMIYVPKALYNAIVSRGEDPGPFAAAAIGQALALRAAGEAKPERILEQLPRPTREKIARSGFAEFEDDELRLTAELLAKSKDGSDPKALEIAQHLVLFAQDSDIAYPEEHQRIRAEVARGRGPKQDREGEDP